MAGLDMQYIADIVPQAQAGDSNAFAEFFAATYQKQFAFARRYLGDDFLAQEAVQQAYINAFRQLYKLRDPSMSVVWLNQITMLACFSVQDKYAAGQGDSKQPVRNESRMLTLNNMQYSVRQIMTLPFSESQAILLSKLCGMKTGSIASLLEIKRGAVRRYITNGINRLKILSGPEGGVRL